MVSSLSSLPEKGPHATKLAELKASLSGRSSTREISNAGTTTHTAIHPNDLSNLAEALFSRAPQDYIKTISLESMLEIAEKAYKVYKSYLNGDKAFIVETLTRKPDPEAKPVTALYTITGDRPFIVDTLIEYLRHNGLERYIHLHPILLEKDGRRISLTYFEFQHVENKKTLAKITKDIEKLFKDVILITDDFSSIVVRAEAAAHLISSGTGLPSTSESDRQEIVRFLRWLTAGGFVFLGYREWETNAEDNNTTNLNHLADEDLGLFRSTEETTTSQLSDIKRDADFLIENSESLHFSKVLSKSAVHRSAHMDSITIRVNTANQNQTKIFCFLGLLTSRAISQEASTIPFIRQKLKRVLELEGLLFNTHDYKEVISIANSIPKSDLLQYSIERLRKELLLVFDIQHRSTVRASVFLDPLKRFVSVNIAIPREKYSAEVREKIQRLVEGLLSAAYESSEYHLSISDYPLVAVRLLIPNPSLSDVRIEIDDLEERIAELTSTWEDRLLIALGQGSGNNSLSDIRLNKTFIDTAQQYAKAFPKHYQATRTSEGAIKDIGIINSLSEENSLELDLENCESSGSKVLRMYKRGETLTLSEIVPTLENVGFEVASETVTPVVLEGEVAATIYDLHFRLTQADSIDPLIANKILLPGLRDVFNKSAVDDELNQLLLDPGLDCHTIAVLRLLASYLWQIKAVTSAQIISDALVQNPVSAQQLAQAFKTRFDPQLFSGCEVCEKRKNAFTLIKSEFETQLKQVSLLIHDRALRALFNVIESAVRTNFFQEGIGQRVALKIDCRSILKMPAPRPRYEVFVCAPEFEGVHLRGGKVARGGLRWSDRNADFRTEVLGLMKTQMVKNSIIIPVGAKGGFVLKGSDSSEGLFDRVKSCYRGFIRSLLEITDNRVKDHIVHPENTVRHDDDDPYLVVAADRGTATFSDVANEIAINDFNFWLGDAFASGGSAGYDHKKYGITARGAWEAVCRHFREIGIDPHAREFTVIGVGDMSGDVFGNGLLLSEYAKLIAAFDHRQIFLDPNPNPATSYAERKRLFELPRSSWRDYDTKLISEGGGVFDRDQKEITLSAAAQDALGISRSMVSGEELIRIILKAPCDLLWNGGIGTYVKAYEEDQLSVGDRHNDDARVDARELRVRVVGEGGNLGMTQRARIEYSRIGGRVNTDAVDNSGGVGLSDLEVNLKILFSELLEDGRITREHRDEIMLECANEACDKILARNRSQTLVISLAVRRSREHLGYYIGLSNALEQEGLLDRKKEHLPDDETLAKRVRLKAGFTRPELAVLISYTKMSLYNTIIRSDIPEDPFFQQHLLDYFPKSISEKFRDDVLNHPLRREIIATQVANLIVERMGASFVYRSAEETGASTANIIRAFLTADAVIRAEYLTDQLSMIDKAHSTRNHLVTLLKLYSAIDGMTRWFLEHVEPETSLSELVSIYSDPFRRLVEQTASIIGDFERNRFNESCKQLEVHNIPSEISIAVGATSYVTSYLDMIETSLKSNADVIEIGKIYSKLSSALQIRQLLEKSNDIDAADHWESLAIRTIVNQVRSSVAELTKHIVQSDVVSEENAVGQFLDSRKEKFNRYLSNIQEFNNRPYTVAALLVTSNQLTALARR